MKINLPTIFSFNLWGPIANSLKYKSLLKKNGLTKLLQNKNNHLLPILNYEENTIEERSLNFSEKLQNLLQKKKIEEFNLISFAINGIDARLSLYENSTLNSKLNKFITINTPHRGTVISDSIRKKKIKSENLEKLNYILGIHSNSLSEINKKNMQELNNFLEDEKKDNFFSVNGDKIYDDQKSFLKEVFSVVLETEESKELVFGDGVFFDEETKFFNHVYQFNADCYDLSPWGIGEYECGYINELKDRI